MFFVIVGGLISRKRTLCDQLIQVDISKVFFKLLMVLLATIPMAGIAAALLVGANVASQFIVRVIPYYT